MWWVVMVVVGHGGLRWMWWDMVDVPCTICSLLHPCPPAVRAAECSPPLETSVFSGWTEQSRAM